MSDKEKKILESVAEILPEMDEADKMYLLGQAEGMALMKSRQRKKEADKDKEVR